MNESTKARHVRCHYAHLFSRRVDDSSLVFQIFAQRRNGVVAGRSLGFQCLLLLGDNLQQVVRTVKIVCQRGHTPAKNLHLTQQAGILVRNLFIAHRQGLDNGE